MRSSLLYINEGCLFDNHFHLGASVDSAGIQYLRTVKIILPVAHTSEDFSVRICDLKLVQGQSLMLIIICPPHCSDASSLPPLHHGCIVGIGGFIDAKRHLYVVIGRVVSKTQAPGTAVYEVKSVRNNDEDTHLVLYMSLVTSIHAFNVFPPHHPSS